MAIEISGIDTSGGGSSSSNITVSPDTIQPDLKSINTDITAADVATPEVSIDTPKLEVPTIESPEKLNLTPADIPTLEVPAMDLVVDNIELDSPDTLSVDDLDFDFEQNEAIASDISPTPLTIEEISNVAVDLEETINVKSGPPEIEDEGFASKVVDSILGPLEAGLDKTMEFFGYQPKDATPGAEPVEGSSDTLIEQRINEVNKMKAAGITDPVMQTAILNEGIAKTVANAAADDEFDLTNPGSWSTGFWEVIVLVGGAALNGYFAKEQQEFALEQADAQRKAALEDYEAKLILRQQYSGGSGGGSGGASVNRGTAGNAFAG